MVETWHIRRAQWDHDGITDSLQRPGQRGAARTRRPRRQMGTAHLTNNIFWTHADGHMPGSGPQDRPSILPQTGQLRGVQPRKHTLGL